MNNPEIWVYLKDGGFGKSGEKKKLRWEILGWKESLFGGDTGSRQGKKMKKKM